MTDQSPEQPLAHHFEEKNGRRWLVVMHPDGCRHMRNPVHSDTHAAICLPIMTRLILGVDALDDERRARIRAAYALP